MKKFAATLLVVLLSACSGDPDFQRIDPHTPFWGASQNGIEDDTTEEVYLLQGIGNIIGSGGYMAVELSRSEKGSVGRMYRSWLSELEGAKPESMSIASINGRQMLVVRLPQKYIRLVAYKTESGFDKQKFYICSERDAGNGCAAIFRREGFYVTYTFNEDLWPREDELYHVILGHVDKL